MKTSRFMALALAGIVTCGLGVSSTQALGYVLSDDNSTVQINALSPSGMHGWKVDGINQLSQQWFWYRIGSGPEASIDTLGAPTTVVLSDTNGSGSDDTLFLRYDAGTGFEIEVRYALDGGTAGSGVADIAEQISINSTGGAISDFSFFQYSDFDLNGTSGDDSVVLTNANTWTQTDPTGTSVSETIATPGADHFEAGMFPTTISSLDDGASTTLSDTLSTGPGDVTWAFQWDFDLAANGSFIISKDKNIAQIPAPGAVLLAVMGMGMIGRIRRRNA